MAMTAERSGKVVTFLITSSGNLAFVDIKAHSISIFKSIGASADSSVVCIRRPAFTVRIGVVAVSQKQIAIADR